MATVNAQFIGEKDHKKLTFVNILLSNAVKKVQLISYKVLPIKTKAK